MSGVSVGSVNEIKLDNNEVFLAVKVKKSIKIPKNARFRICSTGIVGTKFIDIYFSDKSFDNEFIKEDDIIDGDFIFNIADIITKITNVSDTNEENDIFKIIKNVEQITSKINKGLGDDEKDIKEIIDNIKIFSKTLSGLSMKDMKNISEILTNLNKTSKNIEKFMQVINSKKGAIGSLMNDEQVEIDVRETIRNLKNVTSDVQKLTGKVKKIEFFWDADFHYNHSDDMIRNSAGITIQTSPNKRYFLKINNIKVDKPSDFDEGDQKYNSITALIEKDFMLLAKHRLALHAGAMNSSFGIGSELFFNKFSLGLDAHRFEREINDKNITWINAIGYYQLFNWLKIKAGVSDIFERKDFISGIDVSVKDEDISYLFGLIGLTKL
jgi:phospholipid/cholesterol/gamma-HCH transport system substrate-binding protein